ncbi:MAG TPA: trehalose-phosphatase [Gaiellaceae bacterium]|nr:trehalose-phosphatase [Gaiellaceae bacterium]
MNAPVRLVRFRSEPEKAAVFLDVDGTLAPIVDRPEDAAVPAETRQEVERLAGRYALVACISGRPAADARAIVGLGGVEYVGVHGLESHPGVPEYTPQLEQVIDEVDWPWRVERKAGVTVAFHYREVEDEESAEAVERVVQTAEGLGLAVQRGRKVVEVRPPIDADKGTAVRALLAERRLDRALYAGDDTTDLDAFRGLDEAGLDVVVKVAVGSREMNPRLLTEADVVVDGPGELLYLLRTL